MRRATLLLITALLVAAAPRGARAQGNVSTTITPTAVVFPAPGLAEFTAGYVDAAPVTVHLRSRPTRFPWELQIRSDLADLGGYGKPVSDILWRPDHSTTWQPLSTADQVVATGAGDTLLLLHFRMRLDWAYDEPGDYGLSLTFSALRP